MVQKSMKKLFVGLAFVATVGSLSASSSSADSAQTISKSFFQPRPSSANIAREMLMQPGAKHVDADGWYTEFSATIFYQHNWSQGGAENGLGAFPFWSGINEMTAGTNINASTSAPSVLANLDAWQFGLGDITVGSTAAEIELNPIVYQAGSDFMFILGSSANESGFIAKIKAPVVAYSINPQLTEENPLTAVAYPAGTLAANTTTTYLPATSMTEAFAGNLGTASDQGDYSVMQYGLIDGRQSTGAKFGDIEMTAGYRFVTNNDNVFSVALRASAPTGNKATSQFMLEPIVGRGGNWGLGGYAAGRVSIWEGNNDNRLSFQFMGDAMHLFSTSTMRSYDLTVNGPGSRYLLVANYYNNVYQDAVQNLINYTTLSSTSSFDIEGDVAFGFNYAVRGWSIDLGYEFFGRSVENLEITGNFLNQAYAVLGSQGIGFRAAPATPSQACQPGATIASSVAAISGTTVPTLGVIATGTEVGNALTPGNRIPFTALDVDAAAQAAYLTSKVFTKIAYEWEESRYVPFIGVIGELEFSNCSNSALPQWATSVVGGISF